MLHVANAIDPDTVVFKEQPLFEKYIPKPSHSRCRWNLLWLILLMLGPFPLWLTFVNCRLSYEITICVFVLLSSNFAFTSLKCWQYMWRMIRAFNAPFWERLNPKLRVKVQHLVIMPTYKEPIEVLMETLESVANQSVAHSIIMVVGLEEKTPEQETKMSIIKSQFENSFNALVFTIHPLAIPGEIPGACSNRNWAAREGVKYMIKNKLLNVDPTTKKVDLDYTCVTVCDSDTIFFRRYFENLTWYVQSYFSLLSSLVVKMHYADSLLSRHAGVSSTSPRRAATKYAGNRPYSTIFPLTSGTSLLASWEYSVRTL